MNNPLKYTDPSGYSSEPMAYSLYGPSEKKFGVEGWTGPGVGGSGGTNFYPNDGSFSSYTYDWINGGYYNSYGEPVPYAEVHNNYVIPNSYAHINYTKGKGFVGNKSFKLKGYNYLIEDKNNPDKWHYWVSYTGNVAQSDGGSNYAWAGVLAFAGTAAVADGPIPIGDAIGGAVVLGYGTYVLADKMATEISRIAEKVNNTRGFVYELRVNSPGTYVNVRGVPTQMNAGDVWKYGETTKGFGRYSQSTLDNMIPGGVSMVPIFQGNVVEIKIQEKIMIYGYSMMNGHLPPGNRIYR